MNCLECIFCCFLKKKNEVQTNKDPLLVLNYEPTYGTKSSTC